MRHWAGWAAAILLSLSVGLTGWMILTSLVTFAQPIDSRSVQNHYIGHITTYGAIIAVLQVAAFVLMLFRFGGRKAA